MWTHPILKLPGFLANYFILGATKQWVGGALMLAGGALGAVGQMGNASAQAAQMNFNARQAELDAQIARENAAIKARQIREYGRQLKGKQRTQYAKSGVRMSGTPLEVLADTMEKIELDAISVKRQGEFQAGQSEASAKFTKGMAGATKKAGTISAFSTMLGSGAQASTMFS